MYREHFGLRDLPFTLTPDTSFFFPGGCYTEALNVLLVALRSGEGFIKITGEVGTGKTMLCRMLLNAVGDEFVTAYIPNPSLAPKTLRMALAEELGIRFSYSVDQHQLLKSITDELIRLSGAGKRVVVIVDEAQALPDDSLEALRLLSNLETERHKLLQLVLFGQPELDRRLEQPSLRQFRQRIAFSCRLRPIDRKGLPVYLAHRLAAAGHQGGPLFHKAALNDLYRASGGIPRLVNILCHKALMAAYGCGAQTVARRDMAAAIRDTESVAGTQLYAAGVFSRSFSRVFITAAATVLGIALYYLHGGAP